VDAASQVGLGRADLFEHSPHALDVDLFAGMRCTRKCDLFIRESECFSGSRRQERHRLKRFRCGTKKRYRFRLADLSYPIPLAVNDANVPAVYGLDSFAAYNFGQDRWVHKLNGFGDGLLMLYHFARVLAGSVGDLFAGEHAGDLFDAFLRRKFVHGYRRSVLFDAFFDREMPIGE